MNFPPPTYTQPNCNFQPTFLSDEDYAAAISSLIVVCSDILLCDYKRRTIYLAKRKAKPLDTWWHFGGRIRVGEHELDAAIRLLKRETSLEFKRDNFHFVRMQRHQTNCRQQKPQAIAGDYLCYVFFVDVTPEQVKTAAANLDENEFERIPLRELSEDNLYEGDFHPSLTDLFQIIFPSRE